MLVGAKRSQMFWSALTAQLITALMLGCMFHALRVNEGNLYTPAIAHSFPHFLVKFPCLIGLHLLLSPEVAHGMKIMKYAN